MTRPALQGLRSIGPILASTCKELVPWQYCRKVFGVYIGRTRSINDRWKHFE